MYYFFVSNLESVASKVIHVNKKRKRLQSHVYLNDFEKAFVCFECFSFLFQNLVITMFILYVSLYIV